VRAADLQLAGVPVVGAHSMRGLHATLAMDAGITGAVVAASLGHEHISTTTRSYAKGEAVAGAQQRRALTVLAGGVG
jgi:integrase